MANATNAANATTATTATNFSGSLTGDVTGNAGRDDGGEGQRRCSAGERGAGGHKFEQPTGGGFDAADIGRPSAYGRRDKYCRVSGDDGGKGERRVGTDISKSAWDQCKQPGGCGDGA